jgi:hypothetical protein
VRHLQGIVGWASKQVTRCACGSGSGPRRRPMHLFGVGVVAVGLVFAQGGCRAATTAETMEVEPIEECQQYESTLDACFHRKTSFSSQPSLVALVRADRARAVCAANLKELRASCR